MRKMCIAVSLAALSLGACTTLPSNPSSGIRSIGPNLFVASEMDQMFGGSVVERAATFCNSFGQRMSMEGSSSETGVWSGNRFQSVVFTCEGDGESTGWEPVL